MTTTSTAGGRTLVKTGTATVSSVTVLTKPHLGIYSLHDCVSPAQAELYNMVWPINFAVPGAAAFPLVHVNGVVIHEPQNNQAGTYSVTYT